MATRDDILGAPVEPVAGAGALAAKAEIQNPTGIIQPKQPQPKTYVEMLDYLNPYTPPTAEELEKERKKQKSSQIVSAVGDGLSALSNLFFTTQGAPNMYTGNDTLSGATKARFDKIKADRDAHAKEYFSAYMRARQMDEQRADADRAWQRTLDRDKIADERYAAEQQTKKASSEQAQANWRATFEYNQQRDQANDDFRKQQLAETRRQHNAQAQAAKDRIASNDAYRQAQLDETRRQHNAQAQAAKDRIASNERIQTHRSTLAAAKAARGNQLGFSDGNGNQVSIYENVWKGSMQQVYNVLAEDMRAAHERDRRNYPYVKTNMTAQEKEDFVKQNWHRSPRAAAIMYSLSQLDPATMVSEINMDDDFSQYQQQNADDDFSQYAVE